MALLQTGGRGDGWLSDLPTKCTQVSPRAPAAAPRLRFMRPASPGSAHLPAKILYTPSRTTVIILPTESPARFLSSLPVQVETPLPCVLAQPHPTPWAHGCQGPASFLPPPPWCERPCSLYSDDLCYVTPASHLASLSQGFSLQVQMLGTTATPGMNSVRYSGGLRAHME